MSFELFQLPQSRTTSRAEVHAVQHFKVLRDTGLIRSERVGVEMRNTSRCAGIESRFPGLLPAIIGALGTQSERSGARASKRAKAKVGGGAPSRA